MKKALKVLGYVLAAVILIAGSAVTYLYARKPDMAPPAGVQIERTAERFARGKYLFTLTDCDGCHSERDFTRFGGPVVPGGRLAGAVFPKEMGLPGTVVAPNITPDVETGIGAWTDGEIVRAIREGIGRDGNSLFPMMPYQALRKMSDEDAYSLVAYLRTIPPVKRRHPRTQIMFPVSLMVKGAPKPTGHVPQPDLSTKRKRGEYLVSLAGCQGCHTPSLGGGEKFTFPGVTIVSANISSDIHTGIGRLSEQDFVDKFAQYRDYVANGSPKVGLQSFTLMPWLTFATLPDEDLRAIYHYLHSLPPVDKSVETHPGFDPQVKQMLVSTK